MSTSPLQYYSQTDKARGAGGGTATLADVRAYKESCIPKIVGVDEVLGTTVRVSIVMAVNSVGHFRGHSGGRSSS